MATIKDQAIETKGKVKGGVKVAGFFVGAAQLALAAYAGVDLAKRADDEVNGPKALWAGALAINWIGPAAYLTVGRKATYQQIKAKVGRLRGYAN